MNGSSEAGGVMSVDATLGGVDDDLDIRYSLFNIQYSFLKAGAVVSRAFQQAIVLGL